MCIPPELDVSDETKITFPANLTIQYTDELLTSSGVSETNLTIWWLDQDAGSWVELVGVVNASANTVTVSLDHFSVFSLASKSPSTPELGADVPGYPLATIGIALVGAPVWLVRVARKKRRDS
ncbi:MAG: hypothetical protein ACTSU5_20290 [Promethearchaeota archaeon]